MKERLKKAYKKLIRKSGLSARDNLKHLISLKPEGSSQGNVLISYIVEPFLENRNEDVINSHTHHWESFQIVRTFLNLGYSVDIIDYRNNRFRPQKKYVIFLAARTNFQRIAMRLDEDCLKIVHLDTAHWLFNNTANYMRTLDFQNRRGVSVKSVKLVEPNWAVEYADCATVLGNVFTINT